jgi:AraC family transcriptional activator of mtrCDE
MKGCPFVKTLSALTPSIRVAHHYKFQSGEHFSENRIGYCYAFHLFTSGKGKVQVENRLYPVTKGSLLFLRPEQVHSFYPDPLQPYTSYNIYAELWTQPSLNTNIHLAWSPEEFDSRLLTPVLSCVELDHLPNVIALQQHPLLQDWFARLVHVHQKPDQPYADQIARSLLYVWILELYNASRKDVQYDPRIQHILSQIEVNPSLSYSDLLEQSGIRKTQFHDLFKSITGQSPKNYLLQIQMKHAAVELSETSRSVSQISEALGFSSIHYFSRRFTSYYGISPTAYRHGSMPVSEDVSTELYWNENHRKK